MISLFSYRNEFTLFYSELSLNKDILIRFSKGKITA